MKLSSEELKLASGCVNLFSVFYIVEIIVEYIVDRWLWMEKRKSEGIEDSEREGGQLKREAIQAPSLNMSQGLPPQHKQKPMQRRY